MVEEKRLRVEAGTKIPCYKRRCVYPLRTLSPSVASTAVDGALNFLFLFQYITLLSRILTRSTPSFSAGLALAL